MKSIRELGIARPARPIRFLQFGEGNFLRAFVDEMIDTANERGVLNAGIAIVKPIRAGSLDAFSKQDNLYTVCLRGKRDGQTEDSRRVVTCVERVLDAYEDFADLMELACLPSLAFVVSNTTEAGIVFDERDRLTDEPPSGFPGKLTKLLFIRWSHFAGAADRGLTLLPVELIEDNGGQLLRCVREYIRLWALPEGFSDWVETACVFCSTLVDRIVTGYPKGDSLCEELFYRDELLDVAEPFGLWVVEDPSGTVAKRLPLDQAGLPVVFTADLRPYRERKVRILNGAHTSFVLGAYLMGRDTVGECMKDPLLRPFLEETVLRELVPTVPLPREEAERFARQVFERFENPFVKHALLSIALNSVSKWKARVLPPLRDYLRIYGRLPRRLCFSFAALLCFYTGVEKAPGTLVGKRHEKEEYEIQDTWEVLCCFKENCQRPPAEYVQAVCTRTDLWGEDLTLLPGFADAVTKALRSIRAQGMERALCQWKEG